jgi:hypothetical protein
MGVSSRALAAGVAALACSIAACDTLLGLGQYTVGSACEFDCDAGPGDAGGVAKTDDGSQADTGDGGDADRDADRHDVDAEDSGDAAAAGDGAWGDADGSLQEGDIAPPTAHEIWAHWPMPNPEASIAVGSDAALPHPMAYAPPLSDGGAGNSLIDSVTGLTWQSGVGTPVQDYGSAASYCAALPRASTDPGPWRVPTRIELVSLIDFTRQPTIDVQAFSIDAGNIGTYWSSSVVPDLTGADAAAAQHWIVSFADGSVTRSGPGMNAAWVRCVQGGAQ